MTNKFMLLSLIIYAFLAAGLITRNGAFLALAVPVIVYLGVALLFAPAAPQLRVSRTLSHDRATPEQPVTVTVTVTNDGASLPELMLVDAVSPTLHIIEGAAGLLTTLDSGESVEFNYQVLGKRGLYRFSAVSATVSDQFGLFSSQVDLSAPAQFFVLPELVKLRRAAIRPRRVGLYSGQIPARQGGPGVEFFGVREYQPGDPVRWINSRATARYPQTLFVNEFEQERMVDVGIVVDARRQSDVQVGSESLFEYSIQAAAALAETFLGGGNRVGLLLYGRSINWTFPGYGKVQQERIMRSLAQAEQGVGEVFEGLEHLPTWLFPLHSQIVLISPLLPGDAEELIKLRARGYRVLVISPNPIDFERQTLPDSSQVALAVRIAQAERDLLFRKLRHAQIRVVDWPVALPFYQVAHTSLSRLPWQRG
ncbi:MAG: DUF58 domain-containing protein [Anaerolineae bacterium]|nr:DUF58 domain-containing protein [Anaerolineae bacterium]